MSAQSIDEVPGLQRGLIAAYVSKPVDLAELPPLVERILAATRDPVLALHHVRLRVAPAGGPRADRFARCLRCNGPLTLIEAQA